MGPWSASGSSPSSTRLVRWSWSRTTESPVLPGVFYTRVAGVSFHDDAFGSRISRPASNVEIRPEPANPTDRTRWPSSVGERVGYIPAPIAKVLAPSGTRVGRGTVMMEWSTNGVRHDIWILGSMRVTLAFASEE